LHLEELRAIALEKTKKQLYVDLVAKQSCNV